MKFIHSFWDLILRRKVLVGLLLLALILVLFYLIFFYNNNANAYITQKISRVDIEQSIEAVGEVYAKEQVDVGAQVSGQIIKLYVDIGDRVQVGDMIAQIDKDKQQNELDITKAQLASARAILESKKVALEIAQNQYSREQKLYKAEPPRLKA